MKPTQKLTFSINPLIIIIVLLLVILGMLGMWRPWEGSKAQRTITVTGTAEIEATPDEFTFAPYFQRTGSDTSALKTELNTFGDKLQTELKKLGVYDRDITLNSNSYEQPSIEPAMPNSQPVSSDQNTVTLSVSIKASTKTLAQKVQDYLATTDAKGQLTASANFSQTKSRQLEDQARDKATQDARDKADRTAKNLGGSVGKVISVKDSPNQSIVYPLAASGAAVDSTTKSSLPVTPGTDKVNFSVEAVFELR
jgi:uncharacterized protein